MFSKETVWLVHTNNYTLQLVIIKFNFTFRNVPLNKMIFNINKNVNSN